MSALSGRAIKALPILLEKEGWDQTLPVIPSELHWTDVCHAKSPMAEEMEIMLKHPWMGTLSSCQRAEKIGDVNHGKSCFS